MRHPPYRHQRKEYEGHWDDEARFLAWSPRTGKSKVTIDIACRLYREGRIDGVLIFAPNGVHTNWIRRELPAHRWNSISHRAMAWSSPLAHQTQSMTKAQMEESAKWRGRYHRLCVERKRLAWLAVNVEALSLGWVGPLLLKFIRGRRFLLVCDESQVFGRTGSKWTQRVRTIARKAAYRRNLSGSMDDNSPLQVYPQYDLLQKGALGYETMGAFKERYAIYEQRKLRSGRSFPQLVGFKNLDELRQAKVPWTSLVLRQECDDMPELIRSRRYFELDERQRRAYLQLREQFLLRIEEEEVIPFTEGGARLLKMQQCLSGWVTAEDGTIHELVADHENPRLQALEEECALLAGKAIIWCMFRRDVEMVAKRLAALGGVVRYYGGISDRERQQNIEAFTKDPRIKWFVGQPASGGRGLNLSVADDVVWFSHTPNYEHRLQGDERATMVGGKHVGVLDIMAADSVDDYVVDGIQANKSELSELQSRTGLRELLDRVGL